jgi:hypothetical protein
VGRRSDATIHHNLQPIHPDCAAGRQALSGELATPEQRSIAMTNRHSPDLWFERGSERTRNWLALGLLLAAWNFSDNDAVRTHAVKPQHLHHHDPVTVRSLRATTN